MNTDYLFMKEALVLAEKGRGSVSPNPMVGALLVKEGRVIGRGYHRACGEKHAEAEAFDAAEESVLGADLYCTLEPCSSSYPGKKQPPCCDRIIASGVKRVIIAQKDPNPKVNGQGIERLKKAGIDVVWGVCEEEALNLNEAFNTVMVKKRPLIHLKWAQSLDGRIAAASGESKWITGKESRTETHRLRARHDAILVGKNTVVKDDPSLTTRMVEGSDPLRVILDTSLSAPLTSKVYSDGGRTLVFCSSRTDAARADELKKAGVEVVFLEEHQSGLSLSALLEELKSRGVLSLLVEGGSCVTTAFLKEDLWDSVSVFSAPLVMGDGLSSVGDLRVKSPAEGVKFHSYDYRVLGSDILFTGKKEPLCLQES